MNKYMVGRTIDEINDEFTSFVELTPREKAMEMIFEARDLAPGLKRQRLISQALSVYPHLPDAYDLLVEDCATSAKEAIELYEKAVKAGEADLGEEFFRENEGHFWGMTESRPYMRAKVYLAEALWAEGRENEAIQHYQDCLRLNPNDNQGVRDPLLSCLLIKNDLEGVEKILKQYKDDCSASHAYSKALFLFKKYGAESKKAAKQIALAEEENPFIPDYLLGKKKLPKEMPSSYIMGGKEEAQIYVYESYRAWTETPGAIAWLRATKL
jgi:tetratricopeptide (TPR) repeat protein